MFVNIKYSRINILSFFQIKIYLKNDKNSIWCTGLNVLAQNSCVEILTSNVIVLGGGNFGRKLGDKDGALMNWVSVIIKGTPESSLMLFLPCADTMECLQSVTHKRVLTRIQPGW